MSDLPPSVPPPDREPDDVPPPPPPVGDVGVPPPPPPAYGEGLPTAPPPPATYTPGYGVAGVVPQDIGGVFYSKGLNILLFIVTCGVWGAVWAYRTHGDLKKYNGDGIGELAGLLLGLFVGVVIMFTAPNEIQKAYERDGRESPVSTLWGLWFLLPIVGMFIWYFKVQNALNEFWLSKGSQPGG